MIGKFYLPKLSNSFSLIELISVISSEAILLNLEILMMFRIQNNYFLSLEKKQEKWAWGRIFISSVDNSD